MVDGSSKRFGLNAESNGTRVAQRARELAEAGKSQISLTWDMDTGWAGDSYNVKWFETEDSLVLV